MKGLLKRMHKGNAGFTLVELVVVIAILGVLAAIALPNFTGAVDDGQTEAAAIELDLVQTAMDVMMAREGITAVTEVGLGAAVSDFSSSPAEKELYPDYLRSASTTGTYYWGASGNVAQATTGY